LVPALLGPITRPIPETIVTAIVRTIKGAIPIPIAIPELVPILFPVRLGLVAIAGIGPGGSIARVPIAGAPAGAIAAPTGLVPGSLAGQAIAPGILKAAAATAPVPVIPFVVGEQLIFEGAQGVLEALEWTARLTTPLAGEPAIEAIEGLL
jgi:hypothetical protein